MEEKTLNDAEFFVKNRKGIADGSVEVPESYIGSMKMFDLKCTIVRFKDGSAFLHDWVTLKIVFGEEAIRVHVDALRNRIAVEGFRNAKNRG